MNRNPVLNSPNDITDELIHQIINNDLDSLTINYEFTKKFCRSRIWDDWNKEQFRIILPYLSGFIFRTIILDQICN